MARRSPPVLFGYGAAALAVAFATLAAVLVEQQFPAPNLSLVFVLPVVFAATAFGWGPALAAAHVPEAERLVQGDFLRLWPHVHSTDGFFAATWQKA